MNYKDYQQSRDSAWKILLDCRVTSLPVRVSAVCRQLGIHIRVLATDDPRDGVSTIIGDVPYIGINRTRTPERLRFTVAHEVGHIILGHVGRYDLVNREPSPTDSPVEQAANVFASRLLAPACVLWGCRVRCAEDIRQLCGISRAAAEYRMERMRVLYQRGRFFTSPLEQQVYDAFNDFICRHRIPADSESHPLLPR